jgi:kanamycin kinase
VSVPSEPVPVPAAVVGIAEGRQVVAVWVNELGGVTFDVDGGREYVKVSPPEWAHHLVAEAERLRWAAAFVQVPRVLGAGRRSTRAGWPIRAPRHGR